MADYVLSAKGTYDGSNFDGGVEASKSKLDSFMEKADQVGARVRSALGSGFAKAADTLTSGIGTIGAAVTGLAATGGIHRALNIEQAQFKLKQMGLDVEAVMASCNEAVKGTAYGLDAAATVASSLGASGVQAGDQMTRALKGVAGMAAMSGRSMEDVGLIFGKVAATGKLQGDELNQMAEAGVNATASLAKYLGKTQAEVREMVSAGKIDFQTFSDAMYATFGTAASGANETFSGAMSNVRAALSRTGEQFASPALDALRQVFVALIPAIDSAATARAACGRVFRRVPAGRGPQDGQRPGGDEGCHRRPRRRRVYQPVGRGEAGGCCGRDVLRRQPRRAHIADTDRRGRAGRPVRQARHAGNAVLHARRARRRGQGRDVEVLRLGRSRRRRVDGIQDRDGRTGHPG